jgi:Ser/Thr protein kinase RdoA (MazF antagonist)
MSSQGCVGIVERALTSAWGFDVRAVKPWTGGNRLFVYEAETDGGRLFVKAAPCASDGLRDMVNGARVQTWLNANGFPANEVLATTTRDLHAQAEGYVIFAEPWIRPEPVEWTPGRWEEFGRVVGRLHSLPVPRELARCPSRMEPRRCLERVRTNLREFATRVPSEYRSLMASALEVAHGLDDLGSAPRSLIHSDLACGNVMRAHDDRLLLVDFYGAGVGPPVVDLAEVTTYLCRGPSASGPLMEESAIAFYAGYAAHRRLTGDEIRLFPAAHLFHQVYYLDDSLSRGDYDFLRRMSARLGRWNGGVLEKLAEIATGPLG